MNKILQREINTLSITLLAGIKAFSLFIGNPPEIEIGYRKKLTKSISFLSSNLLQAFFPKVCDKGFFSR
ncbi:MAG: hypothetical protein MI921_08055 [Cytophagales bacterium]|nr:hypothetical protein [Cytophagales bacterium]